MVIPSSIGHEFVQKIVVKKTAKRTGEDEQSGTESFELFSVADEKIRSRKTKSFYIVKMVWFEGSSWLITGELPGVNGYHVLSTTTWS